MSLVIAIFFLIITRPPTKSRIRVATETSLSLRIAIRIFKPGTRGTVPRYHPSRVGSGSEAAPLDGLPAIRAVRTRAKIAVTPVVAVVTVVAEILIIVVACRQACLPVAFLQAFFARSPALIQVTAVFYSGFWIDYFRFTIGSCNCIGVVRFPSRDLNSSI